MPEIKAQVAEILVAYNAIAAPATAERLRALWLQFEPKSMTGISAELREQQETVGIPVPILKEIGKEIGKAARRRVEAFIPLARLLWEAYGREGRVVAVHVLGPLELAQPETILPLLLELGRTCITWEDADQLAMNALEPIVRKAPATWLPALEPWLTDANKWVRRASITVAARLPMAHPDYVERCLKLSERLLFDAELDVKRAVSFAIRIAARFDAEAVREFLACHVPPQDPAATWVLCDAIRSMGRQQLPDFAPLLLAYERWANEPALAAQDRRSVESAVKYLRAVGG